MPDETFCNSFALFINAVASFNIKLPFGDIKQIVCSSNDQNNKIFVQAHVHAFIAAPMDHWFVGVLKFLRIFWVRQKRKITFSDWCSWWADFFSKFGFQLWQCSFPSCHPSFDPWIWIKNQSQQAQSTDGIVCWVSHIASFVLFPFWWIWVDRTRPIRIAQVFEFTLMWSVQLVLNTSIVHYFTHIIRMNLHSTVRCFQTKGPNCSRR